MENTTHQIISAFPAQSLQEQMFLLTTFLTPGSAAGAAQYPAALLWKEMLSIWIKHYLATCNRIIRGLEELQNGKSNE